MTLIVLIAFIVLAIVAAWIALSNAFAIKVDQEINNILTKFRGGNNK